MSKESEEQNEEQTIDWGNVLPVKEEDVHMDLRTVDVGQSVVVVFLKVKPAGDRIVAEVESTDIEGNHLWLKGDWGPQNGLLSLIKAADGGDNIEGRTFTYTKVASDKSPAGYAHRWTVE